MLTSSFKSTSSYESSLLPYCAVPTDFYDPDFEFGSSLRPSGEHWDSPILFFSRNGLNY